MPDTTEQYDRLERLVMSYGMHVRRVERYQVINVRDEVVVGGNGATLAQIEEVFSTTLDVINRKVESGELVRLPGGLLRDSEADAWLRANEERKDWEAAHLGPDGDYVDLGGGRVIERANYDPEKHGPIVCGHPTEGCSWSQNPAAGKGDCCESCHH